MVKISVIIPVYNVKKYLRDCLDSVVNQTIKDIEIICIDDGSTDGSLDILNKYSMNDKRFKILVHENLGPSVARNKGIKIASGKYITFVDSDDYLLNEDYLEKLYNACEKYNADIAVAGILRGRGKNSVPILKIEKEEVSSDYKEKLRICDVPESNYVWNKLYRKSSWLNTGLYFPEGMLYEDIWITHKILFYTDILVSAPEIKYFYRKRKGSIVKTKSLKAESDCKLAQDEMYRFFKEHNVDVSDLRKQVKKYKLFGLTVFKTIIQLQKRKNILFNIINWNS